MAAGQVRLAELTLFARAPVAGETKTRLIPALGAEGAASLYRAFLEDVTERFASAFDVSIACAGDLAHPHLQRLANEYGLDLCAQSGVGLGERMSHSLRQMSDEHGRGVIVGTDMPTLPKPLIDGALRALDQADVVLGPTADGGYYLVGCRGHVPELFADVRFSGVHALADTVAAAERSSASVAMLTPWYDIDGPSDLALLRAHLALDPAAAPRTASYLLTRPEPTDRIALTGEAWLTTNSSPR